MNELPVPRPFCFIPVFTKTSGVAGGGGGQTACATRVNLRRLETFSKRYLRDLKIL